MQENRSQTERGARSSPMASTDFCVCRYEERPLTSGSGDKTAQRDRPRIPMSLSEDGSPARRLGLGCTLRRGSGQLDPHGWGDEASHMLHGEIREAVPETEEGEGCLQEWCSDLHCGGRTADTWMLGTH